MNLDYSSTQRGLNVKMKIGGLEALDLICCFILCATLNLLFGSFSFGPFIVFGVPGVLLICLYFGKRGRPDDFLKHLIKFYLTPGHHSASKESSFERKMRRRVYGP